MVLKGKASGWAAVNAGFLQGSILVPLLFLVDINDLSTGFSSNPRLFAGDTSFFTVIHDRNTSANELNNDLPKIKNWHHHGKISFNPDLSSNQVQEVIFPIKIQKIISNIQVN